MCRTNSYTGRQLTDNNTDRQYLDHLQVMIQFMLKKLVFLDYRGVIFTTTLAVSTFQIMSLHHYCIDRYSHTAHTHTHSVKHTHSLFQGIMRHYVNL